MVVVTQAQPEAVDFIKNLFGGSYGISRQQNNNHRPLYRWGCYGNITTSDFLRIVEPYLKIKKK